MVTRVLLAEPSPTIQKIVTLTLKGEEAEVAVAGSGNAAFELVKKHPPHIVLASLDLPEANGLQLCEWMKADPRLANIPFLLLAEEGVALEKHVLEEAGVDGVIEKPFNSQDLIAKVNEAIAQSGGEPMSEEVPAPEEEDLLEEFELSEADAGDLDVDFQEALQAISDELMEPSDEGGKGELRLEEVSEPESVEMAGLASGGRGEEPTVPAAAADLEDDAEEASVVEELEEEEAISEEIAGAEEALEELPDQEEVEVSTPSASRGAQRSAPSSQPKTPAAEEEEVEEFEEETSGDEAAEEEFEEPERIEEAAAPLRPARKQEVRTPQPAKAPHIAPPPTAPRVVAAAAPRIEEAIGARLMERVEDSMRQVIESTFKNLSPSILEIARVEVQKMLPRLAEVIIRQEIERLKRAQRG